MADDGIHVNDMQLVTTHTHNLGCTSTVRIISKCTKRQWWVI